MTALCGISSCQSLRQQEEQGEIYLLKKKHLRRKIIKIRLKKSIDKERSTETVTPVVLFM